ncbi:(+)-neomenthol dehydrogenase-like [Camellia sinensis]|uniref:(+)-neomenthol dehydrogenase-like n=1 Tax=Camellia sinensis TaxID=4442 RepID=UPI001036E9A2|nr:(+)-neomenthol dehydrogenase-like [Camellia sinensis]
MTQSYELGNECLQTNYYGTKRMIEALNPLLQLSDSPRIVNVSSMGGKLELIPSEWAKGVLNDVESLTEERVEEVLNEFLKDFKQDSLETKGWPTFSSAYTMSKAAINAYTRILAKKYPTFRINCVCPGWVKTDINNHIGKLTTKQGAQCPVKLALLPDDGPSGLFFIDNEPSSFVYAVVIGLNKGTGFEICRQLASKGIIVVLTTRDEKKGFEALEKLKSDGLSDHVGQLDVVDPSSVASLADFIKSKFGRHDILVNNARILGTKMDWDSLQSLEGSWLDIYGYQISMRAELELKNFPHNEGGTGARMGAENDKLVPNRRGHPCQ